MNISTLVTPYQIRESRATWALQEPTRYNRDLWPVECLDAPEWIVCGSHTGMDSDYFPGTRIVTSLGVTR